LQSVDTIPATYANPATDANPEIAEMHSNTGRQIFMLSEGNKVLKKYDRIGHISNSTYFATCEKIHSMSKWRKFDD
jgi:hypothetical protein